MTISASEYERACWARSIESVLENRVVFDAFRQFLKASAQPSSQETAASKCAAINNNACATVDVLDLHFMILAFRAHAEKRHPRTAQIALALHRRFISLRTGTVNVIPEEVRSSISSRVHSIRPSLVPSPELFEPCVPYVWEFLCEQHSLFVCSKDFCELLHKLERDECGGERLADEAHYEDDVPVASTSCATSTTNTLDSAAQEQSMIRVPPGISFGKFRQRKTRSRPRSEPPCAALQGSHHGASTNEQRRKQRELAATNGDQPRRNLYPRNNRSGEIRHERREDREEFARILSQRLNAILDAVQQREELFFDSRRISDYWPAPGNFADPQEPSTSHMAQSYHPRSSHQSTEQPQVAKSSSSYVGFDDRNDFMDEEDEEIDRYAQRRESGSLSPRRTTVPASFNMAQSVYGQDGFAPPPTMSRQMNDSRMQHQMPAYSMPFPSSSAASYLSLGGYTGVGGTYYSDTSGFCSSESAHLQYVDHQQSAFHHVDHRKLYEKARMLSAQAEASNASSTLQRTHTNQQASYQHPVATMPRTPKHAAQGSSSALITVTYKESDGVPFVAKIQPYKMTFRDFRHHFGISSKANKRFLFKSECEDGSAPYQWTIATEDSMVLPVYDGRITAECRSMSDSD